MLRKCDHVFQSLGHVDLSPRLECTTCSRDCRKRCLVFGKRQVRVEDVSWGLNRSRLSKKLTKLIFYLFRGMKGLRVKCWLLLRLTTRIEIKASMFLLRLGMHISIPDWRDRLLHLHYHVLCLDVREIAIWPRGVFWLKWPRRLQDSRWLLHWFTQKWLVGLWCSDVETLRILRVQVWHRTSVWVVCPWP